MAEVSIAIVGGGPKAAALCAKAACLRSVGVDIDVVVFERRELGSSWSGEHGFTDGLQPLCTPIERDLGFPYDGPFGEAVDAAMVADYSWTAHAVREGDFADWVDRGRKRPTHADFAAYIAAAIHRSGATQAPGDVQSLRYAPDTAWTVRFLPTSGGAAAAISGFNGVVVTGSGPPIRRLPRPASSNRLFDGASFWSLRDGARGIADANPEETIVIIGSGGTTAAIAAWLVKAGVRNPIQIIGSQASMFARTDSAFENRTFSDEETWRRLSGADRRAFTDRLTRGAVWATVIDTLADATHVSYLPGRGEAIALEDEDDPAGPLLVTHVASARDAAPVDVSACLVIEATGFDGWWFRDLLTPSLKRRLEADRVGLEETMRSDLSLDIRPPGLHAPSVSQFVHPGYASLMSLGSMADAVLQPYVELALSLGSASRH